MSCFLFLFVYNFAQCVKVEVFEHVVLGQVNITKGTAMVTINRLVDAFTAVDMPTASNEAVINLVEAYIAEKLLLKCLHADIEISVCLLFHSDKQSKLMMLID